ncbi:MAG: hypothetical protein IPL78_29515 [Chloroflexi bacterium]|nr:hypothetical protein [Chloroflexota bacterium]
MKHAAGITHRSFDDLLLDVMNVALSFPVELPEEITDDLAAMSIFSDAALWAASESSFSLAQQRRLQQLNRAGGSRPLTLAEKSEQAELLELYDRSVLRRSRALALLSLRGYALPQRNDWTSEINHDPEIH